jgi:hypothetical protein
LLSWQGSPHAAPSPQAVRRLRNRDDEHPYAGHDDQRETIHVPFIGPMVFHAELF